MIVPARWGIRVRLVVTAVGVVLVAMVIGGAGLVYLLEDNLETSATQSATARAGAVADVISSVGLSESTETAITSSSAGLLVQIVAPDGSVFSSSSKPHATRPFAALFPQAGQTLTREIEALPAEQGEWVVAARGVRARGTTFVVQVAVPIGVGRDVVRGVLHYLLIAMPLLLAGVAAIVWLVIGRALRAVERIRATVAGIDSRRLTTRLEVPGTRDEIAALAETMNAMLDRLERSDVAQRRFVSDASHELRSPLASLSAAAELAETAPEPRRTRLLATVRDEAARLHGLVADLMALTRAENVEPRAARELDLDDVVGRERVRVSTTSSRQVVVSVEPVRVHADVQAIDRLVRNLVDNAVRHAATTVRVGLSADAGFAVLTVDDDGPGIDPPDRERIFERFVRLDESRSRDAGGSGLGLAIARGIARSHGGSLVAEDAADGWCRFRLRLPITPPA